jgi:hypothetical protein
LLSVNALKENTQIALEALMKNIAVAGLLALVAATSVYAAAESVTGELVTVMCVAKNGEKGQGPAHVDCAIDCAKKGYPLAVLTPDGSLYKITGALTADNNAKLQSLLAATVTATGEVAGDGSERTIDAATVVRADK